MSKYYIRPATLGQDLNPVPDGFMIGTAGIVKISSNGAIVTLPSGVIAASTPYMISFTKMHGSGATTAANIFFLYEVAEN